MSIFRVWHEPFLENGHEQRARTRILRGPIGGCGARWSWMGWLLGWLPSDLASHGWAYERSAEIEGDAHEIEDDTNGGL